MLEFFGWIFSIFFTVIVLGFAISTLVMAVSSNGHSRYNDEDDAYIVMPDGTVRFDNGG